MNDATILPLFVAIPLAAAFITPLCGLFRKWLAPTVTVIAMATTAMLAIMRVGGPMVMYAAGGWSPPFGINLISDQFTILFQLLVNIIALLVAVYSLRYMAEFTGRVRFYTLFLLMVAGMNGVIATGDLFNLFVFLEIAAIASYGLVAFGVREEELEAAFKYLVLGSIGSAFILLGIALVYSMTGTLNLAHISVVFGEGMPLVIMRFTAAIFLLGFGLKAAMVPFHAWLPDAHSSAPAPISAMLSGLLIKTLGVYVLFRLFLVVYHSWGIPSGALITLGVLSMTVGGLLAIAQTDFKRLLAYSSISQIGYIALGIGIGTPLGYAGALLHLVNHAVFKSLLFLCAGAVEHATGTRDIGRLGGLWRAMPVTSSACMAGSLSIAGIPPFGGFFSKLVIVVATVQAVDTLGPVAYLLAAIAVSVGFMTMVYFAKLQKQIFFGPLPAKLGIVRDPAWSMGAVMLVLAAGCLALGVFLPGVYAGLVDPAVTALRDTGTYVTTVLGGIP